MVSWRWTIAWLLAATSWVLTVVWAAGYTHASALDSGKVGPLAAAFALPFAANTALLVIVSYGRKDIAMVISLAGLALTALTFWAIDRDIFDQIAHANAVGRAFILANVVAPLAAAFILPAALNDQLACDETALPSRAIRPSWTARRGWR